MSVPLSASAHLFRRCVAIADSYNMFIVEKRDNKTDKPVFLLYRHSEISSKKNILIAKRTSVDSLFKTLVKLTGVR